MNSHSKELMQRKPCLQKASACISEASLHIQKSLQTFKQTGGVQRCGEFLGRSWGLVQVGVVPPAESLPPYPLQGAKAAGLRAAYINRDGQPYPSFYLQPDLEASSMTDLAQQLDTSA